MQPPTTSGQPALSILVLLPASAHMTHNPSPLAPARKPSPLVSRNSGSTIPTLKPTPPTSASRLRSEDPSPDNGISSGASRAGGQVRLAGRRSSLAPGMGSGTEIRSPELKSASKLALATVAPSPPGTPDRSASPSPGAVTPSAPHANTAAFDAYKFAANDAPSTGSTTATSDGRAPVKAPAVGTSSEAPAFGSRRPPGSSRPRRPVTAATSQLGTAALQRGSMALPSGAGLGVGGGSANSKNRPGWEADEIVSVLRTGGLEVTLVRNASHLPPLLSSPDGSKSFPPSIAGRPTSTRTAGAGVVPVILVPLCDSPSLPSLSLLLAQGTTPTAVCFQQDLLERAKQTEDEWLPSALASIRTVVDMRNQASVPTTAKYERPIILAYSANPALSPNTTQACISAGASGAVKPPFHSETARMVKRMVRAARDGRISSVVDLPPPPAGVNGGPPAVDPSRSPLLSWNEEAEGADVTMTMTATEAVAASTKVVLPPTALDMGGEHEGEKVLSAAMTHRRQLSLSRSRGNSYNSSSSNDPSSHTKSAIPNHLHLSTSISSSTTTSAPAVRIIQNRDIVTPVTARTDLRDTPTSDMIHPYIATLSRYCPSYTPRRRSVDVGCLSNALNRATRAFEAPLPARTTGTGEPMRRGRTQGGGGEGGIRQGSTKGKKRRPTDLGAECGSDGAGTKTHLAELLSAMYTQSTSATDVQMAEYNELSAPLSPVHRQRLVEALATWNFKPHRLDDGDLYRVATLLFEAVLSSEGVAELGIQGDQINRLLFAIRAIYHAPNPYHNYVHAIDVLQATYSFLMDIGLVPPHSFLLTPPERRSIWKRPDEEHKPVCGVGTRRAREVLRPQDVFAVLVAAMGHDVGHPGLSNAFMKNAKTPLSEVYDDKSVLENMHCMLVVRLLRKHGFEFLITPPTQPRPDGLAVGFDTYSFRKVLYSSVLATDMSLHFAWIARLKDFGARLQAGDYAAKRADDEHDRIMISQAIIKCADISNPTRPIDVSEHWSSVLLEEWAKQASLEQELDLPVSVIASADAALQAKGQIGFIDLFTQPLFEAVSDILPELQGYADSCAENRSLWQTRLDEFASQPEQQRMIVQPAIEAASSDDRFRSLFPLLLPPSLLDSTNSEFGAASSSTASPLTPPVSLPPPAAHSASAAAAEMVDASTRAMRAVYHTDLLEHKHRGSTMTGAGVVPIPGVGGFDWDFERRMSTPTGV